MTEAIKFGSPPLIETAMSVQFNNLAGFTAAHAGWFWKDYVEKLGDGSSNEWKQITEAPKIPEVVEKFGAEDLWVNPSIHFSPVPSSRVQIIRTDGERMIQVQDNRFVLNWRKGKSPYPSYDVLLPEFRNMLHAFELFSSEAGFGSPVYNLWEIVYVNHVTKDRMWETARDLSRIFPALKIPSVSPQHVPPSGDETVSADWRFSLADNRGRLYIQIRQIRLQPSSEEVISFTTTARGPVNQRQSWEQGMNFGHEATRDTFLTITSEEAQEIWGKRT